jgi:hypothetical protein
MNYQTKIVLRKTLYEFRGAERAKQDEMVSLIEQRIKQHQNALKTTGTGYADHFVQAGKIFLRIAKKD